MLPSTSAALNLLPQGFSRDLLRHGEAGEPESNRIASALGAIGVLGPDEFLTSYQDISPWHRGGAETFISEFEICSRHILGPPSIVRIVAKAIVAWGRVPDIVAYDWELRQNRLREGGVNVPQYYGYWQGVFLQLSIPFSFIDYFSALELHRRDLWLSRLRDLAEKIDLLGFQPISLVEDLRTDGVDLYVVDFGEDLGGAGMTSQSQTKKLVASWVSKQSPEHCGVRT